MPKKSVNKQVTNEELARMIANGFSDAASNTNRGFTEVIQEISGIKQDLEDLTLKFDHVVYKFEVKDLQKRLGVVERKVGIK